MKHLLLTTIAAVVLVGCGPSAPDISIHNAATDGNIEAVKQHLAAGTDVNAKDQYGHTPLYTATVFGHQEIVELLIENGADVDVRDSLGRTPMHKAAANGHKEIVELLIAEGADVNAKRDGGDTPLDTAYFTNRLLNGSLNEIIVLLRKHGGKTAEELKAEGK